jgi:hypothetical protein
MALTTFGIIVLIGAALSLRFTILILFPAIIFVIIGVVARGDSIGAMMLTIGLAASSLQIGYLLGLIPRRARFTRRDRIASRGGRGIRTPFHEIIAAKHPVPSTIKKDQGNGGHSLSVGTPNGPKADSSATGCTEFAEIAFMATVRPSSL